MGSLPNLNVCCWKVGSPATRYFTRNSPLQHSVVRFDLWDIPELSDFENKKEEYLQHVDAVLIMFDLQRPDTYDSVPSWWGEFLL